MHSVILGLLAETSIHPGAGQSLGTVDLPVSRESSTDYPVIFGSGVKGALKDKAQFEWKDNTQKIESLFGKKEEAGKLVFSDARLLLLPVRSLTGRYRWLTCPMILERFSRDMQRIGKDKPFEIPSISKGQALGAGEGTVFLEERQVTVSGQVPTEVVSSLKRLFKHEETAERLQSQLMFLCDDDFVWFARYALQVNARNVLDEKKTSKNLWYEETLPPDSLFYALVAARNDVTDLEQFESLFAEKSYVQMGGNETVGQGWFAAKIIK